jgi:Leucine-rich repeat (LRR) protein
VDFSANFLSPASECGWFQEFLVSGRGARRVGFTCHDNGLLYSISLRQSEILCETAVKYNYFQQPRISHYFFIHICFSRNNLIGTLPEELALLTALELINLSVNDIQGTLPPNFGDLHHLLDFYMHYNNLDSIIPESIGNLTRLGTISVSHIIMTGYLPVSMRRMENLTYLALDDNSFLGSLTPLNALSNLTYVYVDNNSFEGGLQDVFMENHRILDLDMSNNVLDGPFPHHFLNRSIQILDLSRNMLTGSLSEFTENSRLQLLSLFANGIRGSIPTSIANAAMLSHLDVSLNYFTGVLPEELFHMTSLTFIFLAGNNFTAGPIANLTALANLT